MILKINNWIGRLGNNIIQVRNVLQIALYYNYNVEFPKHEFFKTNKIILNENTDTKTYCDNEGNNFFYSFKIKKFNQECFNNNIEKMKEILRNIVNIDLNKIINHDNSTLVIHIRGGDLFTSSPPPQYITPPLNYYENIIDNNQYNKIYIIAEDNLNPVIKSLKQNYPNITIGNKNLSNDINTILSARNIVSSIGTFIPSLLLFNKNIQTIFYPSYSIQLNEVLHLYKDINCVSIDSEEYKALIDKWRNTKDQQNLLLNYKYPNSISFFSDC